MSIDPGSNKGEVTTTSSINLTFSFYYPSLYSQTICSHNCCLGYRHIHLEGLDQATVFVHISITDHHGDKVTIATKISKSGILAFIFHKTAFSFLQAIDISDNVVKEKQQSGGVKFKKRLMRNNSIM